MAIIAQFEANDSSNAFVAYYCFTIIYIDRERETYKIYRRKVNGNDRKANWNWKNLVETVETEWNFGLDGSEAR